MSSRPVRATQLDPISKIKLKQRKKKKEGSHTGLGNGSEGEVLVIYL